AGGRRLRVEAAVAGAVVRPEHGRLAVETVDRAPHVRLVQQHARVVHQVAGREVVRAVDDQVVRLEDLHHVVRVKPRLVQDDLDGPVGLFDRLLGRLRLRLAYVGDAVNDLALQVRLVDGVEVDDAERAHAGRGQVKQRRGAEAARAPDKDLRVLQAVLPGHGALG